MSISINPAATLAPPSSFLPSTSGYTQGLALADPAASQWLLSGAVASSVTQPVWGGMGIQELVAAPGADSYGNNIAIAASIANITGFSVFNRGYNMLTTPGNNVQTASAGMSIPYFRFGSNIRIPVLCTSALITAVEANGINTQVQWDTTNQQLIPFASGTALPVKVVALDTNSKVVSYNSGTGAVTWSTGNVAVIQL
jgi:hypothetical protein